MDLLDCHDRSRCDTCRHSTPQGCGLELALDEALAPRQGLAAGTAIGNLQLWMTNSSASAAES